MSLVSFMVKFLISAFVYQILMLGVNVLLRWYMIKRIEKRKVKQMKNIIAVVKQKQDDGEDDTWH